MTILLIALGVAVFLALALPAILTFVSVKGLSNPKLVPLSREEGSDAGSLPHTQRGNPGSDILHGIINGKPSCHNTPRGIDVQVNVLVRIL